MTQAELGDALGISGNAITKIENGRSTLGLQHLERLPNILGQPLSWFLGLGDEIIDLTSDEEELLAAYRALPAGWPRKYGLEILQGWVKFREEKE